MLCLDMIPNILQTQHGLGAQSATEKSIFPSSWKLLKVRRIVYLTLKWQGLEQFYFKKRFVIIDHKHLWYLTLWVV